MFSVVLQVNVIAVYRIVSLDIVVPKGIRTPVAAVKGQCPRPLDDGDLTVLKHYTEIFNKKII